MCDRQLLLRMNGVRPLPLPKFFLKEEAPDPAPGVNLRRRPQLTFDGAATTTE
jgi:hypothetical protein